MKKGTEKYIQEILYVLYLIQEEEQKQKQAERQKGNNKMATVKHYSIEASVTPESVTILNREIPFTIEDMTELGLGKNVYITRSEIVHAVNTDWDDNKSLDFIIKLEKKIVKALEEMIN